MNFNEIWTAILAVASAIVLLSQAAEKIGKAIQAAKAPNTQQNERLDKLERHMEEVDSYLAKDKERLNNIEDGNRATQQGKDCPLDHGIDGNNIKQMQDAKEALQNHLINR